MRVRSHALSELSVEGPHLTGRLYPAHFHAHLSALEFDQDRAGLECVLQIAGELLSQSFLKLRLASEMVQRAHDAAKASDSF